MAVGQIVLVFLLLDFAGSLATGSGPDCKSAAVVQEKSGTVPIRNTLRNTEMSLMSTNKSVTMFLQAGSDFKKMNVEVNFFPSNRTNLMKQSVWVSLNHCNLDSSKWEKMQVNVSRSLNEFHLMLRIGSCIKQCTKTHKIPVYKLSPTWEMLAIVSRDSYKVRYTSPPATCLAAEQTAIAQSSCTKPSGLNTSEPAREPKSISLSHTLNDTSTGLSSAGVSAIALLVVVAVVLMAVRTVVVYNTHRRKLTQSHVVASQCQPANPAPQEAEPVSHSEAGAYFGGEDDLYLIPIEYNASRHDIDNESLYTTIPGPEQTFSQNITSEPLYVNLKGKSQQASQNIINDPMYANMQGNPQKASHNIINDPMYVDMKVKPQQASQNIINDPMYVDMKGYPQQARRNIISEPLYDNIEGIPHQDSRNIDNEPLYDNIEGTPHQDSRNIDNEPLYDNI